MRRGNPPVSADHPAGRRPGSYRPYVAARRHLDDFDPAPRLCSNDSRAIRTKGKRIATQHAVARQGPDFLAAGHIPKLYGFVLSRGSDVPAVRAQRNGTNTPGMPRL